jgi:uncharacterized damage-inducible protein DinB
MELLLETLDRLRETILTRTAGLDDTQLGQRLEPSTMTLGGLLSHLANVEDWWVNRVIAGRSASVPWRDAPWAQDRDWDWNRARELSAESLVSQYREAISRSRLILEAPLDPDAVVRLPGRRQDKEFSVRWVLMHLIVEYARHCGHADLLRESIDGVTG